MTATVPTRASTFTARTSTVSSDRTTAICCMPWTFWTARWGMVSAFFLVSTTARTLAYWPGRSTLAGFENTPRASTVPAVTSTWRSSATARPRVGYTLPSARISSSSRPCEPVPPESQRRNISSARCSPIGNST